MSDDRPGYHKPLFEQIPEARREAIIKAAEQEFADRGFAAATMGHIATAAGVSVGSLYQYFPHKEALYQALVHRGFETLEGILSPLLQAPVPLEEKIRSIVDAIFDQSETQATQTRLYHRFTSEGSSTLTSQVAKDLESFTARHYSALLAQAREEGRLSTPEDARLLAFCMDSLFLVLQFSLSGGYFADRMGIYLGRGADQDPRSLREGFTAFIVRGLGLAPASPRGEVP